jgi:adenosylcobinamide-GDP ribazoletransferase
MSDPVRLAVGTLTRFTVPAPRTVNRTVAGRAMLLAPGVGAVLGAVLGLLGWLVGQLGLAALPASALLVAVLAYTTRGLHLDGLADTADGLGSGRDATGALAIMRDGAVGPMGAVTLVLVLAIQVSSLEQVLGQWGPMALAVAVAASRCSLTVACAVQVPPARPGGLGAAVLGSVPPALAAAELALVAAVGTALLRLAGGAWPDAAAAAVGATAAAAVVAWATTRVARQRLGGATGDVLGAAVELSLAAALLVLALRPA